MSYHSEDEYRISLHTCLYPIFVSNICAVAPRQTSGPRLNIKTVLSTYGDFHVKIRRPLGRLIFNMGITIPYKTVFLIETAPRLSATLELARAYYYNYHHHYYYFYHHYHHHYHHHHHHWDIEIELSSSSSSSSLKSNKIWTPLQVIRTRKLSVYEVHSTRIEAIFCEDTLAILNDVIKSTKVIWNHWQAQKLTRKRV